MEVLLFILLSVLKVSGSFPVNPQEDGSSLVIKNTRNRMLRPLTGYSASLCEAHDFTKRFEGGMVDDPTYSLYLGNLSSAGNGEAPYGAECSPSTEYGTCPTVVYWEVELQLFGRESIAPPQYMPSTFQEPCTKCDLHYHKDASTFAAPCTSFECPLPPDKNIFTPPPENVTVHYKVKRSDFFRPTQYTTPYSYSQKGHRYGCSWQREKKSFTVDFEMGVTNVRTTTFVLINSFLDGNIDPTPGVDDSCWYFVDGVPCSSCNFCNDTDPGQYELDCWNIRPGAIASCDDETNIANPLYGYFPKLLIVQEGYVFPTDAPTLQPSINSPQLTDAPQPIEPKSPGKRNLLPVLIIGSAVGVLILVILACVVWQKYKENNKNGRGRKQQSILPLHSKPSTDAEATSKQAECTIVSTPPVGGESLKDDPKEEMAEKPVVDIKAEKTLDKHQQGEERDDDKDNSENKTTDGGHGRRDSHRHHHHSIDGMTEKPALDNKAEETVDKQQQQQEERDDDKHSSENNATDGDHGRRNSHRHRHHSMEEMAEKPMLDSKKEKTVDKQQEERDDGKHSSKNKATDGDHGRRDSNRHCHHSMEPVLNGRRDRNRHRHHSMEELAEKPVLNGGRRVSNRHRHHSMEEMAEKPMLDARRVSNRHRHHSMEEMTEKQVLIGGRRDSNRPRHHSMEEVAEKQVLNGGGRDNNNRHRHHSLEEVAEKPVLYDGRRDIHRHYDRHHHQRSQSEHRDASSDSKQLHQLYQHLRQQHHPHRLSHHDDEFGEISSEEVSIQN